MEENEVKYQTERKRLRIQEVTFFNFFFAGDY